MVECLGGLARITSKELAPTHFVKGGTLQNACSARPRIVADVEKSARMHIVRLMNNLVKGLKNDDKSAVAMLKKYELHDRTGQPNVDRDIRRESNHGPVGCSSSNTRHLGCVFQDMKPPKSILRKSTDMPKTIQRVKFTKAIARHTKIRDHNPSLGYIFIQVNLISAAPTLQNLRIGLRKRQSGKSKVPAKQRNTLLTFGK